MNKLVFAGAGVGLAMAGAVAYGTMGANALTAQAGAGYGHGQGQGQSQAWATKAQVLGMTEDQLRTELQTKTMLQIAEEKGITHEQLQEKMRASAQSRWTAAGLTQAQIEERTAQMEARQAAGDGTPGGMHRYGQDD